MVRPCGHYRLSLAYEYYPLFVWSADTGLSGTDRHAFVFAPLDGQAIGCFAICFRSDFPGKIYRRGGTEKQAKQFSPAKVKAWYH
jgi:hypothetical protein